jgi:spore coat protein U-like protein
MQKLQNDRTIAYHALTRVAPALLVSLIAAGSVSAATLSVGPGKTYAKPCAAFAVAKDGDLVEITGNTTYSGDVCGINASNLTIRGVNGRAKIDAAGLNAMGKGTWVVAGNNVTIENVEMLGARVPDLNGAALRLEGTKFTLRQSFLHDNENGILSGANANSDILIEYSEFGHNGHGDGQSHNLYIGNVKSLTFRYNFSHDANVGHNLKSRAMTNTIVYNRFSSLAPGQTGSTAAGQPSYEIDLPNAGTTYVIGNVIEQPAANQNPNMLAYGEEGASNPGKDLYVVNNTFLNDYSGGSFVMVGSGVTTPVLLQNNIFAGVGTTINQSNAIDKTNYRAAAPGFVNRAAYDLHPTASALVIDAGSAPGISPSGVSLAPAAQYKHVASGEGRVNSGLIDIGSYEAIGTTTSAPAPAPAPAPTSPTPTSPTWTMCANEGGTCSFSGTRQVRYGSATSFVIKTFTGSVSCSNAVFGDPAWNVAKTCSYSSVTTDTTSAPAPAPAPTTSPTWTSCAAEGGTCSFSGTRDVRYGSATSFVIKTFTGSVSCSNAVFGDPAWNVVKSCSFSSVSK